jgi:hypothetical protein
MYAADAAVVVVSAKSGVKVGTEKAVKAAKVRKLPKFFVINGMCDEGVDYFSIIDDLRDQFGSSVCPIVIPEIAGNAAKSYLNILDGKAYTYANGKATECAVPEILQADDYKANLTEAVAESSEELMDRIDRWTAPLFVLFFVFSGAKLDLSVFGDVFIVLIGVAYIISRSAGKYFGARISSDLVRCDKNIVKYLGVTLLPQAGVALGMAIKAGELGAEGAIVRNITLFAVLIYEIVGPLLTKIALTKAGDIKPDGKVSARHQAKLEMVAKTKENAVLEASELSNDKQ